MLFHVFRVLSGCADLLVRIPLSKGELQDVTVFTASASATYHVITLVVYYRWCEVRPAQKPPCMVGTCYDWLRQYVHRLKEGGRYAADNAPSAIQLQRTLGDSEECSASFEFSHRRMADGATEHLLSSQSSCSQEIAKAT
uniref:Uncharacterized protein n=2 Tax=Ixodes ricinus TaxID=34613 RepID=A0A090X9U8_IXORI